MIRGVRAQPGLIDPASVFVVSAWLAQQLRCPRRDLRLTVDRRREPSGIESWFFRLFVTNLVEEQT